MKSRLLATSAIAGLSILQLSAPAQARSLGIRSEQPDTLEISVGEDEEIVGDDIGIYADNGAGRPEQGQNPPAPIDNRRYSKLVATPSGEWVHGSDCRESERARPRASPFFIEKEHGFLSPSAELRVADEPLRWTIPAGGSGRHDGEAASVQRSKPPGRKSPKRAE
ncbi:hypothetical protein [Sphingopyxis terrae]|uniref:hypothetical protein n=1 Tax=Sphingopyxis terrae TaxID=33052 RepID=UPI003F7D3072